MTSQGNNIIQIDLTHDLNNINTIGEETVTINEFSYKISELGKMSNVVFNELVKDVNADELNRINKYRTYRKTFNQKGIYSFTLGSTLPQYETFVLFSIDTATVAFTELENVNYLRRI